MPFTKENLEEAVVEAEEFLRRARNFMAWARDSDFHFGCPATAGIKRQSSELSQALIKLRRSPSSQKWLDKYRRADNG